jgi:hypothetical protein
MDALEESEEILAPDLHDRIGDRHIRDEVERVAF